MDKNQFLEAIKKARTEGKKLKFSQTFDFIASLKGLDLKKAEHQLDLFITLPRSRGKKIKVCALVGPEMLVSAKADCDKAISLDDFDEYAKNKKAAKKLANEYDFFIAQANLMAKVAAAFGRYLGPKGKMPNPKAGCVVPPKAPLKPLIEKLQKTIRVSAKTTPVAQCIIGNEEMKDEELAENAAVVYDSIIHHLPNEESNVRSVFVKLTMGKPVRVK